MWGCRCIRYPSSVKFANILKWNSGKNVQGILVSFLTWWDSFKLVLNLIFWLMKNSSLKCTDPLQVENQWCHVKNFPVQTFTDQLHVLPSLDGFYVGKFRTLRVSNNLHFTILYKRSEAFCPLQWGLYQLENGYIQQLNLTSNSSLKISIKLLV